MPAPLANDLPALQTTGLAVLDGALRVQWFNEALAEILEVGVRGLRGQALNALIDDDTLQNAAARAFRGDAVQLRGVRVATLRDHELISDLALQRLDDDRLLLELHPLTPLPTTAPLSATLRGFAHEVKNPLAGLRGAAQLLQRRVENDELRHLTGVVIAEADRLAALADHLLRNDGKARLARVNIHEVLERLCDLLAAEPDSPRIEHDYDPSLPPVLGDAARLYQLLLNLARNAIDAGARCLTLRTRIEHAVHLSERGSRTVLRVDVGDDGRGVPEGLRDTLFQPLVSGRADGTGLGLALAREIAHEHGGELRFVSQPGVTVFSLYLPKGDADG